MFRISRAGAALLPSLPAGAEVPAGTQIPGIYRLKVGTYEVTILNDGTGRNASARYLFDDFGFQRVTCVGPSSMRHQHPNLRTSRSVYSYSVVDRQKCFRNQCCDKRYIIDISMRLPQCHSSSGECASGSHASTSWSARDRYWSLVPRAQSIIVGAAIKPIASPSSRKASRCEEERLKDRLARNARRLFSDASVSCSRSS